MSSAVPSTLRAARHPGQRAERVQAERRAAYRHFAALSTRWMDNDAYGHLNNVVYYSLFDTAVNEYLIGAGALDFAGGDVIGVVAESGCHYFEALAFPQPLQAGLRVARIGSSSVRYEIGIFALGADRSAACGHFVHVYVDRGTRRPTTLPAPLLDAVRLLESEPEIAE